MTTAVYRDLLARLLPARRFGIVFGLERVRAVLDRLGAPDRRLGQVIHVGGTNGKGSTVAVTAALVAAAGRRVATYTSPHLSTLRERIVIDGAMIGEAEIVDAADRVQTAGGGELTFFEQITAIGMLAIADAGVDVTVLEVGLGGRLDATNVVDARVAVVTGVALDHEAILGGTLDAIAREKAGIFKRGKHAIVGASGEPSAVPLLVELARQAGAMVTTIDDAAVVAVPRLALEGAHQRANAAAAIAAMRALGGDLGRFVDDRAAVEAALASVRHPGRFERIADVMLGSAHLGDVIVDGAHNPHGARALATTLAALQAGDGSNAAADIVDSRPVLVLAVSADKDVAAIVAALAPAVFAIVATRYQQDRAVEPVELARIATQVAPGLRVVAEPDLAAALATAHRLGLERAATSPAARATRPTPSIVVAGSLFIVGEARVMLCGAEADPIWVSDPAPVSQP